MATSEAIASTATVVSVTALAAAAGSVAQRSSNASANELVLAVLGKPTTTGWVVAGVNAAVLGYVAFKLYRRAAVQHEKYKQLKCSAQRLWRLATQGAEAAGPVPEDLGEPDASGVYTKQSVSGTLYFRQSRNPWFGVQQWEWSTDKVFWIPTCHADSLWYSTDSSPSQADKVLIRRLEVEGQLLCRQQGSSSTAGAMLPPLDLSQSSRDLSSLRDVPTAFLCPISMCLMTQPVVTPSGATFDRPALLDWIRQTHTDPLSGQPLSSDQLVPNLVLRDMIHAWLHEGCSNKDSDSSSREELHSIDFADDRLSNSSDTNNGKAGSTFKDSMPAMPATPVVRASRDV